MTLEKPMARLAQRLDRNGGARAISSHQTRLVHSFGVGGPAPAAWREHVLTRVAELQTLTALLAASRSPNADLLRDAIDAHLDSARAGRRDHGGAEFLETVGRRHHRIGRRARDEQP
jgi:hypothetical protein